VKGLALKCAKPLQVRGRQHGRRAPRPCFNFNLPVLPGGKEAIAHGVWGELKDGAQQLKDGAQQLKDGAQQLKDGAVGRRKAPVE